MIRRRTTPAPCPVRARAVLALALALAALAVPGPARALLPLANASGEALYLRECAPCHGPAGHGDGLEAPTFRSAPRDLGDLARAEPSPRIVERVRRSRLRMLEVDETVVADRRKRMVEELVGHLQRMPDVPWPLVRRGADVYAERCEKCHGPNARPMTPNRLQRGPQPAGPQPPPDFQKAQGDAELLRIARGEGHPAMPGFTPVATEQDARALLAYLRILSNGFAWYSLWCAGCHGDEGRGDGPLATGIDQPHVAFDRAYLAAQSPGDLRRKAMHLFTDVEAATPHFQRDLTQGQARAVLAAVRTLQAAEAVAPPPGAAALTPTPPAGVVAQTPAPPAGAAAFAGSTTPAVATPATPVGAATSPATPFASLAPAAAATPAPSVSRTPGAARTPVAKSAKPKTAAAKKAPPKPSVKKKSKPRPTPRAKRKAKPAPTRKPAAARATPTAEPVAVP